VSQLQPLADTTDEIITDARVRMCEAIDNYDYDMASTYAAILMNMLRVRRDMSQMMTDDDRR
jgi:hypothetical protein